MSGKVYTKDKTGVWEEIGIINNELADDVVHQIVEFDRVNNDLPAPNFIKPEIGVVYNEAWGRRLTLREIGRIQNGEEY